MHKKGGRRLYSSSLAVAARIVQSSGEGQTEELSGDAVGLVKQKQFAASLQHTLCALLFRLAHGCFPPFYLLLRVLSPILSIA